MLINNTYINKSIIHGVGVFSTKTHNKGDIIEESHFLEIEKKCDCLNEYYFGYDNDYDKKALILGNISFLNHSENPNAYVIENKNNNTFQLVCLKHIKIDEEITIKYSNNLLFKT